jgi:hypothetical protein
MTPANDLGGMDTDMHEVYFYTFECRRRFRVMDDRHGRAVCPHRPPIGDLISAGNLNKIKESHRILYHRPTATATAAPVNGGGLMGVVVGGDFKVYRGKSCRRGAISSSSG